MRTKEFEDIERNYEEISYNPNIRNLEQQVAKVKKMDDQELRLDTIVKVLGRLKEENDSRDGDFD